MKKSIIILALFVTVRLLANNEMKPYEIVIKSYEEQNPKGILVIKTEIVFNQDVKLDSIPFIELPSGWVLISTKKYNEGNGQEKDTNNKNNKDIDKENHRDNFNKKTKIDYVVSYNKKEIPFYPLSFRIISSESTKEGRIYFTPYNTAEIWSIFDFESLNRVWILENGEIPIKKYVPRNQIPKSDIPDDYNPIEEWQKDSRLVFVEGLAYAIPMKPINPSLYPVYPEPDTTNQTGDDDGDEEEMVQSVNSKVALKKKIM